ncbi:MULTISPECIES: hypothetical protein [Catenuloplanes]|uniref:Uncharacterized protein n=1 Tax=Catenuloplanes niger TaxID=587534 RepID=A0AAE4CTM3_9ACTN|nr:hypothetical protein [Catenuloplanes niger]MDR7325481.1 hypothetical protein [Catenuloplanes niger]
MGAFTYLVTDYLNQPQALAITLSILIGSVTLISQFLIEFEQRLAAVEQSVQSNALSMKNSMRDSFSKINEATDLFARVEASPLPTDLVTQLVRDATQIATDSPPLVYDFFTQEITRTSDVLRKLGRGGEVTYDGEDRDWLLGLTRHARIGIDAISLTLVDRGLWTSEIGQRYLQVQHSAVERGAVVRRIFVIDRPSDGIDPEVREACEAQSRIGIRVRLLDRTRIPATLRVFGLGFIVFDDLLSYEIIAPAPLEDTARSTIAETRLSLLPTRVRDHARIYRELWELASEMPTPVR